MTVGPAIIRDQRLQVAGAGGKVWRGARVFHGSTVCCQCDFRHTRQAKRQERLRNPSLLLSYRRQQVGLQGALPGGHVDVMGSERVP
jgi:hypothetical protein